MLINVANILPTINHKNSINDRVGQVNVSHVLKELTNVDDEPCNFWTYGPNEKSPKESEVRQTPTHFRNHYF